MWGLRNAEKELTTSYLASMLYCMELVGQVIQFFFRSLRLILRFCNERPKAQRTLWAKRTCTLMVNGLSAGQFKGVLVVERNHRSMECVKPGVQIFQKNVGALIVLARYGINKPDTYVDIRGKDKRNLGKVIQDSSAPTKAV
ncbi:hypothetical protein B0H11DRAFT_1909329 [Mycena galericulata]|nr:hypothetical protein B0H11DRAFT_1909329 [Mycena galericulata]